MPEAPSSPPAMTGAPAPGADPAAGDDPVFFNTVHMATVGPPPARNRGSLGGLVVGYGIAGALGGVFLFTRLAVRSLGLPVMALGVMWVVIAGVAIVGLAWLGFRQVREQNRAMVGRISSDPRYRVRCIAPGARGEALRRLGPLVDTPFEPEVFTAFMVLPPKGAMLVVWVLASLAVAGGAYVLPLGIPPGAHSLVFYGAFAAGALIMTLLWPTTVRVVPGRVDVVRRLVFAPGRAERRSFTLRTSRVLVDVGRWRASVQGPTPATSVHLWLWPIPGRLELAHALLLGAVSSARPGPLAAEPLATEAAGGGR